MGKFFDKVISLIGPAVLAALGFSSCDPIINIIDPPCEYGTPNCNFKVDLTVQDENGKALKGIKVIPAGTVDEIHGLDENGNLMSQSKDTLVTDASGKVSRTYWLFSAPEKLKVYFEDPDGDLNGGSFARDSAEFVSTKTGEGNKHWYQGEWTLSGTKKPKKE